MASSIPVSASADLVVVAASAKAGRRARRARWLTAGGVGFILPLVLMAPGAPWLAPHDPTRQSLRARLVGRPWRRRTGAPT